MLQISILEICKLNSICLRFKQTIFQGLSGCSEVPYVPYDDQSTSVEFSVTLLHLAVVRQS